MAVPSDFEQLRSSLKVDHFVSGDASSAKDMGWVDMRDFDSILVTVLAAKLTGVGVTAFKLIANDQANGGGTDREVKVNAVAAAPDAAGDYLVLEASAEEIQQAATNAGGNPVRYVSANITAANAADVIAATYIRRATRAYSGLTADTVS